MKPDESGCHRYILSCYAISFVHFAQWQGLSPFVPIYATDLGATPAQAGMVVAFFGALPFFLAIPAGVLVDRVGYRLLVVFGTIGTAVAGLILLRAGGLHSLAAAVALIGVSQLLISVSTQTFIAVAAAEKDAQFGYLTLYIGLGRTLGPFMGGLAKDAWGYYGVFTGFAVLGIIPLILAFALPAGKQKQGSGEVKEKQRFPLRTLDLGRVSTALYCSFAINLGIGAYDSIYALYLYNLGFSAGTIGLIFSIQNATSIFIRPLVGGAARLMGRYWLLALSMAGGFVGLASTTAFSTVPMLAMAAGLFGLAKGTSQPVSMAIVAESVPVFHRGKVMGLRLSVNRLGQAISPVILGGVVGAVGFPVAFWGVSMTLILGLPGAVRYAADKNFSTLVSWKVLKK